MSLGKRLLDEQNEQSSPSKCPNCKINWDDKFYDYCEEHIEDALEQEERRQLAEENFDDDFDNFPTQYVERYEMWRAEY